MRLLLPAVTIFVATAQTPAPIAGTPRPQFEVATVKRNRSGAAPIQNNMLVFSPGGRFSATNVTLVDVLVRVYPTRRIQMRGGPAWIDSDRYDLLAKASDAAKEPTRQQLREMVQMLLEDRFGLKMHQETRDEPVLAMVVEKNAPKLDPPKPGEDPRFTWAINAK